MHAVTYQQNYSYENQWLIYWDDLNISKDEVQNFKRLATLQMNLTEKIK